MHDYRAPWKTPITKEEWNGFLKHNFGSPDRQIIYSIFKNYFMKHKNKTFCEVGFGQCYDFINCFKKYHDNQSIKYSGFEITDQFVKYAKEMHPSYSFFEGSFFDLKHYDITYTRHVLEHQHPDNCYPSLEALLKATNELCIISWFKPPNKERFYWSQKDGFDHSGAYVNTFDKNRVCKLINDYGFSLTIKLANVPERGIFNSIYIIEKTEDNSGNNEPKLA